MLTPLERTVTPEAAGRLVCPEEGVADHIH